MRIIDSFKFSVRIWDEEDRPMLNPIEFSTFEDAKMFMEKMMHSGPINGKTPALGSIAADISFHDSSSIMEGSDYQTICTLHKNGEWELGHIHFGGW